jgi:RNA polymerase sigma-70 factor, ECF subfamily
MGDAARATDHDSGWSPGSGARLARVTRRPVDADGAEAELNQLVVAAVAGDRDAYGPLLQIVRTLAVRYCRARLRGDDVLGPEDVAQEVCVAVMTALPTYQLRGLSFRAFVYGIAAHKVVDARRAARRDRCVPVPEVPDAATGDADPEQRALSGERARRMDEMLSALTARQREVLTLRIALGVSAEETARILGTTAGAVRLVQHRALVRLRQESAQFRDL